jgi:uridylate kinase
MSAPFDPIASKLSQKFKFKVIILNGRKLKNLENYLTNKNFKGTIIY